MNDPYQTTIQSGENQLIIGSTSISSVLQKYKNKSNDIKDET